MKTFERNAQRFETVCFPIFNTQYTFCLLCYFRVRLEVLGRPNDGSILNTPGRTNCFVRSVHNVQAPNSVVAVNHLKM